MSSSQSPSQSCETQQLLLQLLDLPDDCIALIIGWLPLRSVSAVARTCRRLHTFVRDEPDAWLAQCRVRRIDAPAHTHADARALRELVRSSLFVFDASSCSDGLSITHGGRLVVRTRPVLEARFDRARSVAPVPLDDRVHVYRVRAALRLADDLSAFGCGLGVARPEFAAFHGPGFHHSTESIGLYANGSCYIGSRTNVGQFFFKARALSSLSTQAVNCVHEIHVRMRRDKSGAVCACVRAAVLDARLFADGAAPPMDYSMREPTPDGVVLSGMATTDAIRTRFELHGPWHVVVLLRSGSTSVTALGSAEFEPSAANVDALHIVPPSP